MKEENKYNNKEYLFNFKNYPHPIKYEQKIQKSKIV